MYICFEHGRKPFWQMCGVKRLYDSDTQTSAHGPRLCHIGIVGGYGTNPINADPTRMSCN